LSAIDINYKFAVLKILKGGLSSAGLERYLDRVEAVGSNPTDPTNTSF
jgi:hypothetical protein